MKTIYCLSGLGADRSAFQYLELTGFKMEFIDWISPLEKEAMAHYASRLLGQINEQKPILLGLSFGGMMAIELSKLLDTEAVILLSSAKKKEELHPLFSKMMQWNLMKWMPRPLLNKSNFLLEYAFGVKQKSDKALLARIIADTDLGFLFWALDAMQHWDNTFVPEHLLEIHGTNDKIIPYRNLPQTNTVKGGGHLMVLNRAHEISKMILDYLREFRNQDF